MSGVANPFFKKYNTPHETVPFDRIKVEDYEPAFEKGMKEQIEEIRKITGNKQPATFENTIAAFERSGELLSRVSSVFYNMNSAETNDEIMAISQRISPKMSEHSNNISLDEKLFARIKSVYDQKNKLNLDVESIMLLEKIYDSFVNGGANLSEADKKNIQGPDCSAQQADADFQSECSERNQSVRNGAHR